MKLQESMKSQESITLQMPLTLQDKLQILRKQNGYSQEQLAEFLVCAKKNTYAAKAKEVPPSRLKSHDFRYDGADGYRYLDSYVGGEHFSGEEIVWLHEIPVWSMNYAGRVIGNHFSGDFLKEALLAVPADLPFRGPQIYTKGNYHYHCRVGGETAWFQGYEEIFYNDEKIYECYFHGGNVC